VIDRQGGTGDLVSPESESSFEANPISRDGCSNSLRQFLARWYRNQRRI
jgi:hypothetical protein